MTAARGGADPHPGPGVGQSRRRRRSRPRPEHAVARVGVGLLLVVGWSAVGHASGSGWVVALGGFVAATLLLASLGPLAALLTARISPTGAPADAEAGASFSVTLACSRRVRLQALAPPGPVVFSGAAGIAALAVVPARRGVLEEVEVRVGSAAPFGLVWWSRRMVLSLPQPVHVSPRLGRPAATLVPAAGDESPDRHDASSVAAGQSMGGELRAVREYRHGDGPRRVHWPATAHATTLMVRETDDGAGTPVVVRADLPADPAAAEERAEQVLGTVVVLLRAGARVELETTEAGGRRILAAVADRRAAGRRLARAVSQPPLGAGR
jgi:uncharacterized protein (DUF58 family)